MNELNEGHSHINEAVEQFRMAIRRSHVPSDEEEVVKHLEAAVTSVFDALVWMLENKMEVTLGERLAKPVEEFETRLREEIAKKVAKDSAESEDQSK